jgi:uncharacterized protein YxjI
MNPVFEQTTYRVRRQFFKLFGNAFHVYGADGRLAIYSKQKAFKLKEDIRLYTEEAMTNEILTIQARKVIDFSSAYDVLDPVAQVKVGALRRKGLKSIIKDEWQILDADDREIGLIAEDSMTLALIRRFLTNLVPQTYIASIGDRSVAVYKQAFNPFILTLHVDFSQDRNGLFDRRLGLAAAVLLGAIEGRQD